MLRKKDLLELETRKRIFNFILKYPGLHFRILCIELNISNGTMVYHLNYLVKRGLIETNNRDKHCRYFVSKNLGENDKKLLIIFRKVLYRDIILLQISAKASYIPQAELTRHYFLLKY